jgi:site-specific recombinase XerD
MSELVPAASLADEVAEYGPTRRIRVLVAVWLESKRSEHTRRAYERDMTMWLKFLDENDVDPLQALRAHADIWKNRGAGYDSPAASSLARRLSAVASFYNYLVQEDLLDRSPFSHVARPEVSDESTTRGLTKAQARSMTERATESGPRDEALIKLLLFSGLRESEAILADVTDLGWEDDHRTLDVVRKGGKIQRVALSLVVADALEQMIGDRESGPLFVTGTGARLSASQVFRTVRRVARLADVPDPNEVTPHSLRHTFATLSMDAGVDIRQVQVDMGHADPKTTIRYDRARRRLRNAGTYKVTDWILGDQEEEGQAT